MNAYRSLTKIVAIGALALAVGTITPAFAQSHSSGGHSSGGSGHAVSDGHYSGSSGGHYTGGYHGGYSGGYHGGYYAPHYSGGYRGGYYGPHVGFYGHGGYWGGGWRGGYWHGGFYGPRFGYGWFLPVLPAVYGTYYWGGVPYYYANDAYYTWNSEYNGYVATDPPEGATAADSSGSAPPAPAATGQTYNYPKNGQTEEQQSTDRYQCHQWAVGQSGYDPTRNSAPTSGGQQIDYRRALTACLEGRGYTVK